MLNTHFLGLSTSTSTHQYAVRAYGTLSTLLSTQSVQIPSLGAWPQYWHLCSDNYTMVQ
jgi:hypothetical protein